MYWFNELFTRFPILSTFKNNGFSIEGNLNKKTIKIEYKNNMYDIYEIFNIQSSQSDKETKLYKYYLYQTTFESVVLFIENIMRNVSFYETWNDFEVEFLEEGYDEDQELKEIENQKKYIYDDYETDF